MSSSSDNTGAPQTPQEDAEFITLNYTEGQSSQFESMKIKRIILRKLSRLDVYFEGLKRKAKTREYRIKIAALVKQQQDIHLDTADAGEVLEQLQNLKVAAKELEVEMENAQKRSELKAQLQSLLDADPSFHVAKMFRRLILTDDLVDFEKIRANAAEVNPVGLKLETLLGTLQGKAKTKEQGAEVDKLIARYEFESDLENDNAFVLVRMIEIIFEDAEKLERTFDSVNYLTDLDDKTLPRDLRDEREKLLADFEGRRRYLFQRPRTGDDLKNAFEQFRGKVKSYNEGRSAIGQTLVALPPGNRAQEKERGRLLESIKDGNVSADDIDRDTDRLKESIDDFRQKRNALEEQANQIIREAKGIDQRDLSTELRIRIAGIVKAADLLLVNTDKTSFVFTSLRSDLKDLKRDVAAARAEQERERRIAAVEQEGNRIAQKALNAIQDGDSEELFDRADEIADGIQEALGDDPEGIDPKWQQSLEELQAAVARERAERTDSLRSKIAEAISTVSQTPLIEAEDRARGLSLDAEIQEARAEVARLIEQRARRERAEGVAEQADEAAAYVELVAANAENNRLDLGERLENAEAAQAAVTSERRLLQGVLQILDRVEDQDLYALYDARLRNLRDYAPLVAATRAAYLRQLESERKEGLAQKLRAGEVPLGAAPEPAEAPKPLWDEKQEKAAHELARFMREEPLWYDVYEKWKLHWRRCVNGHRFLEIDNVGSWACRQHALPFDQRAQRFPCCDKAELDPGCVRADHRVTEAPLTEAHNISGVKDLILRAMEGDRPGRAPPGDFVRFDRAEHARRARPVVHWKERPLKTVSVLLPDFLTLERDPADENKVLGGGAAPADMWLWDWAAPRPETTAAPPAGAPVSARIIYLDQLSEFIYNQTKDTVTFKVALLVEDVPVLFQHGRRGVPYRTHPHRPLEFTPLERVRLWASSPR